jgi:ABC-type transport system substrate-binding protein
MKKLFTGGRRKVAAVMAIALVASLSPVSSIDAASKANNLVILIAEKDSSWCAQDSPGLDQIVAKNAVAETLTILNDKGKVVPYLAKSLTPSADFKTWDITLREGIFFHDGEQLSAATVAANLAALLGLTVKGSLPAVGWQDTFGGVTSLAEFARKVQVTGAFSVRLNLPAPAPFLPDALYGAGRPVMLSSKTLASPKCGLTVAAGTGPFKVLEKGVDQFVTKLEANTSYWRKAADGSKLPKAKLVTFKVVLDAAQQFNALVQGSADIATFGAFSGSLLNRIRTEQKGKISLYEGPRDTTWAFHMNTMAAPFNSKNARLAFSYAIDRVNYVKLMTRGNGDPAFSLGASYNPYYVKNSGVKFDLKKAKEYVAAYKAETGKDLAVVIPITDTANSLKGATALGKMIEKAGIKYSLMAPVTSTQFILRGFALQQQLTQFNVVAGRDASFATNFAIETQLELSGFRFTNPKLSACFRAARNSGIAAEYKKCVAVLHSEAYWVPNYNEGGFVAARKEIVGLGATPLPGGGSRPIVGLSGFDFASVTVTG